MSWSAEEAGKGRRQPNSGLNTASQCELRATYQSERAGLLVRGWCVAKKYMHVLIVVRERLRSWIGCLFIVLRPGSPNSSIIAYGFKQDRTPIINFPKQLDDLPYYHQFPKDPYSWLQQRMRRDPLNNMAEASKQAFVSWIMHLESHCIFT